MVVTETAPTGDFQVTFTAMVSSVPSQIQEVVSGQHPHLSDRKTGALRGSMLDLVFLPIPSVLKPTSFSNPVFLQPPPVPRSQGYHH